MQWHRNCQSEMIKAVRSARLGNWKMDHSTNREVICTKCQVQIDGSCHRQVGHRVHLFGLLAVIHSTAFPPESSG